MRTSKTVCDRCKTEIGVALIPKFFKYSVTRKVIFWDFKKDYSGDLCEKCGDELFEFIFAAPEKHA